MCKEHFFATGFTIIELHENYINNGKLKLCISCKMFYILKPAQQTIFYPKCSSFQ